MINLSIPDTNSQLHPRITVVGVGGAGGNAVNNMITANLEGVDFLVANTDAQALNHSHADRRLQLGTSLTQGLGAGSRPEIGQAAAEEAIDDIIGYLEGSHMVFITGGMGGGTGTGAGPVIARAARELGVLTVGVVTKPFHFEGAHRMKTAESGIQEMQKYVDTLIVIPNQNLFRLANEKTTFAQAFQMADEVLHSGVRGVTDLMVMPGLINLDFADIRTVMSEMGKAMMGTGEAEGDKRAIEAAEAAISNPLLDDVSMKGARGVLVNITGGSDMTLYEVDEAVNRIREEVDGDANLIFGSTFLDSLEGKMRVSVVSTGIDQEARAIDPNTGRPQLAVVGGRQLSPSQPAQHAFTAERSVEQEEMILDTPVEPEPNRAAPQARGLDPRMAGVGVEPQRAVAPPEPEHRGQAFLPPKPIQPPNRTQAIGHGRHAQAENARKGGAGRLFKAMTGLLGGEESDHAAPPTGEIASRADALHRQHSDGQAAPRPASSQGGPARLHQPRQDPMTRVHGGGDGHGLAASARPAQAHPEGDRQAAAAQDRGQDDVWSSPESLAGHPPRATGTDPAPQPVSASRPAPQPVPAPARRANQAPLPRHEDDQLDIPAFLRRQAN